ncbi:MAG: hypothetical protein ACLR7N_12410 [Roseburia hominis]
MSTAVPANNCLNGTLRHDWGFDGVVVSDWGGVHDTREAAEAAIDGDGSDVRFRPASIWQSRF